MITTRTPLRISFVGGGTDLPQFYQQYGGAVVSASIDKYIYISINKHFDGRIRVSYSRTENVDEPSDVKHDLVRACLEMYDLRGVEITSISDIPGEGSGLGSSSSFVVGLLAAIAQYTNKPFCSPSILAETAYMIESGCGHGAGKQDHYAAAYGGLHFFNFLKDGHVEVEPICFEKQEELDLQGQLMLFWMGKTRKASDILKRQGKNISKNGDAQIAALQMRDLAYRLKDNLMFGGIYSLGPCLHENWELKKKLADGISNDHVDRWYAIARGLGATGGKVCGAGGGGFLLLCATSDRQTSIEAELGKCGLKRVPMNLFAFGSEVIWKS